MFELEPRKRDRPPGKTKRRVTNKHIFIGLYLGGCALTSTASSPSGLHQLQQFGVDGLPGLLQHPDELPGLPDVPRSEEGVGRAFVGAAGGAADAMDVVLGGVGIVVIDDKLDIFHI